MRLKTERVFSIIVNSYIGVKCMLAEKYLRWFIVKLPPNIEHRDDISDFIQSVICNWYRQPILLVML